ncbi:hypothetical protein DL96DRAFT_1710388 [Flagelloscypha sp. PMI_526]|nr:hypothetical protein DL96DRAFT_1710388 [Flagelloscypha sp. PMI_526]
MATTQPIALPGAGNGPNYEDYPMQSVSPNGGEFNPASYQQHFLGSPISWKMGSFGNRYIPSQSPTARLLNGFDPLAKGSVESDRGSIMNAFNVFNADAENGDYARNYSCCNLRLPDLHALLEHFEEVHIVRQPDQPQGQPQNLAVPFNPVPLHSFQSQPTIQPAYNPFVASAPQHASYASTGGFDPDDMDLGDEESTQPGYGAPHQQQQGVSSHSSPSSGHSTTPPTTPSSAHLTTGAMQPQVSYQQSYVQGYYMPQQSYYPNPIKTSSTSSLDGALGENPTLHPGSKPTSPTKCVTPSLLFDSGNSGPATAGPSSGFGEVLSNAAQQRGTKSMPGTPLRTSPPPLPVSNQNGAPATKKKQRTQTTDSGSATPPASAGGNNANGLAMGTLANLSPQTLATLTGLTSSKPFKCPKPNCNKSYKQANGLKYHMTHGSCVFTPPREVEQVRAIIDEHQRARLQQQGSQSQPPSPGHEPNMLDGGLHLTETELRELEKEADKRLRPFACGVGDCGRRYKNMNGLRYHYQHSGEHGAIGLAMLANGTHDCLSNNSSHHSHHHHRTVQERDRGRSGERGVGAVKKERSKSKKDGSVPNSRNVSRVGTPAPGIPALPAGAQQILPQQLTLQPSHQQQPTTLHLVTAPQRPIPSQQSQQSTFPQQPPSRETLQLGPPGALQLQPTPQQQAQQYYQSLEHSMAALGVQSAPASPLAGTFTTPSFIQAQAQAAKKQ